MMREKDLEGSQMRIREEDGTRDAHTSQKKKGRRRRMTNSLICFLASWPTPWDKE